MTTPIPEATRAELYRQLTEGPYADALHGLVVELAARTPVAGLSDPSMHLGLYPVVRYLVGEALVPVLAFIQER